MFVAIKTFYQSFCGNNFVEIVENMILDKVYENA